MGSWGEPDDVHFSGRCIGGSRGIVWIGNTHNYGEGFGRKDFDGEILRYGVRKGWSWFDKRMSTPLWSEFRLSLPRSQIYQSPRVSSLVITRLRPLVIGAKPNPSIESLNHPPNKSRGQFAMRRQQFLEALVLPQFLHVARRVQHKQLLQPLERRIVVAVPQQGHDVFCILVHKIECNQVLPEVVHR
jgi:hypothetical protein